ncbi:MAG: phosphatidate cytidylyltransferase [Eubacteriaceae bacterium]|nr:phosphatidate cytidylyltransferase [Eubacteriaceae bacterium]
MLKQRVITAAVLIAILGGAVLWSPYALAAVAAVLSVGASYEYSRLITKSDAISKNLLLMCSALAVNVCGVFFPQYITAVSVLTVVVIFGTVMFSPEPDASDAVYLAWGFIYTGLCMAFAQRLMISPHGYAIVLPAFAACALCDTAAYFVGMKFGRHRFCPKVSPKKSWEGAAAGFIAAVAAYSASYFIPSAAGLPHRLAFCIAGGVVIGVFGELGDLAASLVKRKFDVKDYGTVFPGHGGFLDRIDSYLFVFAGIYALSGLLLGIS